MYKKKSSIIAAMFALLLTCTFTSCGNNNNKNSTSQPTSSHVTSQPSSSHVHDYSNEWNHDETQHWHACKDPSCGEKKDVANHTFNWTEKTPAGVHKDKVEEGICSICNYKTTRTIKETAIHSYDTSKWLYDENSHWHVSNCDELAPTHDVLKIDEANHSGEWTTKVEANYGVNKVIQRDCEVCGYHEEKTLEGTSLAPKNREIKANIPELTYNGNPQPVDPYLTMTNNAGGLTVEYRKKGDNLFTNNVPINAGTYEYVAKLKGTDEWLEASTYGEYTIKKVTIYIADGPYTINYVENSVDSYLEIATGTIDTNSISFCVNTKYNVIGRASIPTSEIFIRFAGSINYNANYQVAIEGKDSFELVVLDASPFYCGIQDVFKVGTKTIITTKIAKGTVKVGDKLFVNNIYKEITVTAISKNNVNIASATIGDEVSLKVSGVERSELSRGYIISALNTVKNYDVFKATVTLLSKDEGGRHTPLTNGYNPTLSFTDTFSQFSGKFTFSEDLELFMPGTTEENIMITLDMPKPLVAGAKFNIYEGGKTIGSGVITHLHEHTDLYLTTGKCEFCNLNRQTEASFTDLKFTSTNNTFYAKEYKYYLVKMVKSPISNFVYYYDFEISDAANFKFTIYTTSGIELTLIDGKSLKCTNPLQVIIRVEAKNESTIGDCITTVTRKSVKIMIA